MVLVLIAFPIEIRNWRAVCQKSTQKMQICPSSRAVVWYLSLSPFMFVLAAATWLCIFKKKAKFCFLVIPNRSQSVYGSIGAIKHISAEIQTCSIPIALSRSSGFNLGILFSNLKQQNIAEISILFVFPVLKLIMCVSKHSTDDLMFLMQVHSRKVLMCKWVLELG